MRGPEYTRQFCECVARCVASSATDKGHSVVPTLPVKCQADRDHLEAVAKQHRAAPQRLVPEHREVVCSNFLPGSMQLCISVPKQMGEIAEYGNSVSHGQKRNSLTSL